MWHRYRAQVAGAAVLMPLAYILVLAALAFTAVSVVAPAREVSVLFGVLMGGRLLGEGSAGQAADRGRRDRRRDHRDRGRLTTAFAGQITAPGRSKRQFRGRS